MMSNSHPCAACFCSPLFLILKTMNRWTVATAVLLTFSITADAGRLQFAFERGAAIWVADLDGNNARRITTGSGADLSPDGREIVFNTDDSKAADLVREIAIADLGTKQIKIVEGIPSRNCQRAAWSPDGKQILFSIWMGSDWHLAVVSPNGAGFRYLKKASPSHNSYWSAGWASDGKSIYSQDLTYLYQFDLQGRELKKWKLDSLFPKGSMNSGSSIACSPDGRRLLVEVDMDEEEANLPDWDGPPPSLWNLDLTSEKATRLTRPGVLASGGCWLDETHILFTALSAKEKDPLIEKMDLLTKGTEPVLKNGLNPSVSRLSNR